MNGGIYYLHNVEHDVYVGDGVNDAIDWYISNSQLTPIAYDSLYAYIFKLTLVTNEQYNPFRSFADDSPIQELLLKIVILTNKEDSIPDYMCHIKNSQTFNDFKNEIDIQNRLYIDSVGSSNPICPAILSSYIIHNIVYESFLDNLLKIGNSITIDMINNGIIPGVKWNDAFEGAQLGVIFMEFAKGYHTLRNYLLTNEVTISPNDDLIKPFNANAQHALEICQYEVARMVKKGYLHADLHLDNIMYNPNVQNYIGESFPGKAIIIDFGRSTKTTKNQYKRLKTIKSLLKYTSNYSINWYISDGYPIGTKTKDNWMREKYIMDNERYKQMISSRKQYIKEHLEVILNKKLIKIYIQEQIIVVNIQYIPR